MKSAKQAFGLLGTLPKSSALAAAAGRIASPENSDKQAETEPNDLVPAIMTFQRQHGLAVDGVMRREGPTQQKTGPLVEAMLAREIGEDLYQPLPFKPKPNPTIGRTHPLVPTRVSVPFGSGMGMDEDDTDHRLATAHAATILDAHEEETAAAQAAEDRPVEAGESSNDTLVGASGNPTVPPPPPQRPQQQKASSSTNVPPRPIYTDFDGNSGPRVTQSDWTAFHQALKSQGVSAQEAEVFARIYSDEGGEAHDGNSKSGIYPDTLNAMINLKPNDMKQFGIIAGMTPTQLSREQVIGAYKIFLRDAIAPAKKANDMNAIGYLDRLVGDKETIESMVMVLVREGAGEGSRIIQRAINRTMEIFGIDDRAAVDGATGTKTMTKAGRLAAHPAQRRQLIANIMDEWLYSRIIEEGSSHIKGETTRADSYRIP